MTLAAWGARLKMPAQKILREESSCKLGSQRPSASNSGRFTGATRGESRRRNRGSWSACRRGSTSVPAKGALAGAGSTGRDEPGDLSTAKEREKQTSQVVGSCLGLLECSCGCKLSAPGCCVAAQEHSRTLRGTELTSDYGTLHPPRPSGRCPHRPLIFLQLLVHRP